MSDVISVIHVIHVIHVILVMSCHVMPWQSIIVIAVALAGTSPQRCRLSGRQACGWRQGTCWSVCMYACMYAFDVGCHLLAAMN